MVSSDKDREGFDEYFASMTTSAGDQFMALDYDQRQLKTDLSTLFDVSSIPTLVLLKPNGEVITTEGTRRCQRFLKKFQRNVQQQREPSVVLRGVLDDDDDDDDDDDEHRCPQPLSGWDLRATLARLLALDPEDAKTLSKFSNIHNQTHPEVVKYLRRRKRRRKQQTEGGGTGLYGGRAADGAAETGGGKAEEFESDAQRGEATPPAPHVAAAAAGDAAGMPSGSEDGAFDRDEDVLVGSAQMRVVGIKYYTGLLHKGEFAFLVREPSNPYDPNAIAVKNHVGSQVGHIARELAA